MIYFIMDSLCPLCPLRPLPNDHECDTGLCMIKASPTVRKHDQKDELFVTFRSNIDDLIATHKAMYEFVHTWPRKTEWEDVYIVLFEILHKPK
jgi:hypothetical protein